MPDDQQVADADTDQTTPDQASQPDSADQGQADAADRPTSDKDWKAEAAKWKALARKHEGAAKKLGDLEDAQKTEAQRLEERAASAEQHAAELQGELLRLQVAAAKGLPPELAARLRGGSEEELTEDADRLLALLKPAAPQARPPDARQGVRGQAAAPPDPDQWLRQMAGRL